MAYIQTVLGNIKPKTLGVTMMHEHLLWNQECYQTAVDPDSDAGRFAYSKITPDKMSKIRSYHLHIHRQNGLKG